MREGEGADQAISKRIQRVQEEIIGNEALGGGALDEVGASELLSLGLKSAEGIASSTEGMDDDSAELSMADRLKSLRKLMRHLGRLLGEGKNMDTEGRLWLWRSVQKHARLLFGEQIELPAVDEIMGRLIKGESTAEIIISIHEMFEN